MNTKAGLYSFTDDYPHLLLILNVNKHSTLRALLIYAIVKWNKCARKKNWLIIDWAMIEQFVFLIGYSFLLTTPFILIVILLCRFMRHLVPLFCTPCYAPFCPSFCCYVSHPAWHFILSFCSPFNLASFKHDLVSRKMEAIAKSIQLWRGAINKFQNISKSLCQMLHLGFSIKYQPLWLRHWPTPLWLSFTAKKGTQAWIWDERPLSCSVLSS